jgi:hypothetical protein
MLHNSQRVEWALLHSWAYTSFLICSFNVRLNVVDGSGHGAGDLPFQLPSLHKSLVAKLQALQSQFVDSSMRRLTAGIVFYNYPFFRSPEAGINAPF